MILMPLYGDQYQNTMAAKARGVAMILPFTELTEQTLRHALDELFNNTMFVFSLSLRLFHSSLSLARYSAGHVRPRKFNPRVPRNDTNIQMAPRRDNRLPSRGNESQICEPLIFPPLINDSYAVTVDTRAVSPRIPAAKASVTARPCACIPPRAVRCLGRRQSEKSEGRAGRETSRGDGEPRQKGKSYNLAGYSVR